MMPSAIAAGESPAAQPLPPYVANAGEQFSLLLAEDFVEKHNIAWRVEPGTKGPANPPLEPGLPWETAGVFSHGTVLHDPGDGLWKAWYVSVPEHNLSPSAERRLSYAESQDGVHWVRPELGICSYNSNTRTNILLDLESGGP